MSNFTLNVNGNTHTVDVAEDTPLLYVLRNEIELSGPRMGCEMGQCGACSVLVDGKEMRSCITRPSSVVGKSIVTIEGLAELWVQRKSLSKTEAEEILHPIQQAWIDVQVPQCGYCQSGMMIAAADLLERIPRPTKEQIKDAFTNTPPSPHLCRCGTYTSIIEAVQRAANVMAD